MPQSVFDYKTPTQVQGAAWTMRLDVAPPGSLAAPLFAMYPSLGDVTISTATNIDTVEDGPVKVVRFGNLTVNALLSVTKRCRGLMILCDSITYGASGGISMTGKGAKGASNWPVIDFTIPLSVQLSASRINLQDVLKYIREKGIWIGDPIFWAYPDSGVGDCRAIITPGGVALLSAAGCGQGAAAGSNYTGPGGGVGATGAAGLNGGTGGGGTGGWMSDQRQVVGAPGNGGTPWGGGNASGAAFNAYLAALSSQAICIGTPSGPSILPEPWGGEGGDGVNSGYMKGGGGAGNPGGAGYDASSAGQDGTGGNLFILCRGNIIRNASDIVQADGKNGGAVVGIASNYCCGGGGSGGGHISEICGGTKTGTGTTRANGGLGGTAAGSTSYNYAGGAGGAGSVVTKTFAQMGW